MDKVAHFPSKNALLDGEVCIDVLQHSVVCLSIIPVLINPDHHIQKQQLFSPALS